MMVIATLTTVPVDVPKAMIQGVGVGLAVFFSGLLFSIGGAMIRSLASVE